MIKLIKIIISLVFIGSYYLPGDNMVNAKSLSFIEDIKEIDILTEPGALIFVDGSLKGSANNSGLLLLRLNLNELRDSSYTQLRIESDGFRPFEKTLKLYSNNPKNIQATLSPININRNNQDHLYILLGLILFVLFIAAGKKVYPTAKVKLNRIGVSNAIKKIKSKPKPKKVKQDKTVKVSSKKNKIKKTKEAQNQSGQHFDKYKIVKKIAEGGVAVIYEALNPDKQRVALKVMSKYLFDQDMVNKFIGEGWALQEIKRKFPSAPVVAVYEYGRKDNDQNGVPYIAMELVEGRSLSFFIKNNVLPYEKKVEIIKQLLEAVDAAHRCKVLHRDISPDNVLIKDTSNIEIRLIDFGVARHEVHWLKGTSVGAAFGKPEYMAPEQIKGDDLDYRVDYYSIGVLAYALFSGTPPFKDSSMYKVFDMHINSPVPEMPQEAPGNIRELVNLLLAKKPSDRPSDITQIMDFLT